MTEKKKKTSRHAEFIKAIVLILLIGIALRVFVLFPHKLANTHMENSLYEGDFLMASQLSYKFGEPQTGDIIVFEHPFKIGELRVGRVIAVSGQTVEILNKLVYIDDETFTDFESIKHADFNIISEEYSYRDYSPPTTVPTGAVYILCDNRDIAEDSRNFGTVNIENIKGKGGFVYWSWKPDPNAPRWESPYITPAIKILFYNLIHFPSRIGWGRIGASVN